MESELEDDAYLRSTYAGLGALSPVLRAPTGEVIDGVHRLQVDPGWFSLTIRSINDPVKIAMARLVVNVVRRRVSAEEKTQLLSEIAKLTKWTPQQIAEATGMSEKWVRQYLPSEFKDQKMAELAHRRFAESSEEPVTRRVAESQEVSVLPKKWVPPSQMQQPVACGQCGVNTLFPKEYKGVQMCSRCYDKLESSETTLPSTSLVPPSPPTPLTPQPSTMPSERKPKPAPLLTGFQIECPECHIKLLIDHCEFPNGDTTHKLKELSS